MIALHPARLQAFIVDASDPLAILGISPVDYTFSDQHRTANELFCEVMERVARHTSLVLSAYTCLLAVPELKSVMLAFLQLYLLIC